MSEDVVNAQDLAGIASQLKRTNEDNTPFAIVNEKEVSVVGDANKTEVKKNDYVAKFRIPMSKLDRQPENSQVVGPYYVITRNFEDVTISPRKDLVIANAIMELQPFFKILKGDGTVKERSDEEVLKLFATTTAGHDALLAMYNLIAAFLEIDDFLCQYMLPGSVIKNINAFIDNHPEAFNEADVFFG